MSVPLRLRWKLTPATSPRRRRTSASAYRGTTIRSSSCSALGRRMRTSRSVSYASSGTIVIGAGLGVISTGACCSVSRGVSKRSSVGGWNGSGYLAADEEGARGRQREGLLFPYPSTWERLGAEKERTLRARGKWIADPSGVQVPARHVSQVVGPYQPVSSPLCTSHGYVQETLHVVQLEMHLGPEEPRVDCRQPPASHASALSEGDSLSRPSSPVPVFMSIVAMSSKPIWSNTVMRFMASMRAATTWLPLLDCHGHPRSLIW